MIHILMDLMKHVIPRQINLPQPLNQDLTLTSPRMCRVTQPHTLHQQNERK